MRIRTGNNRRRAKAIKASGLFRPSAPTLKTHRRERYSWNDARISPETVLGDIGDFLTATEPLSGRTATCVIVDDPAELFEDRGPIGHFGRRSIPHSYRGEGVNYVD